MIDIVERLKQAGEQVKGELLQEAATEIIELRHRRDQLETALIMLVRTGWPWDEEGEPNEILRHAKDGYAGAMKEAKELLGLQRSVLTRTEPKT